MNRDMTNMLRATTKMACEGVGQICLDPQIAMCQWSSRLNLKLKKNYYIECRWYMAWKLDVVDALVL